MKMTTWIGCLLSLVFLLAASGCGDEKLTPDKQTLKHGKLTGKSTGTEEGCQQDADCVALEGLSVQCIDGECVYEEVACQSDSDCPDGFICDLFWILTKMDRPDIDPNESYGFCIPEPMEQCQTDADCPEGMVCEVFCFGWEDPDGNGDEECFSECVEPWVPECETDEDCPEGYICDVVYWDECGPTDPMPPFGICIPEPLPPCEEDADCPEGLVCQEFCYDIWDPEGNVTEECFSECVMPPCETDEDCPEGLVCEEICWEWFDPNGEGGMDCFNECILPPCETDADCPDGMACEEYCYEMVDPDGNVSEECFRECMVPWEPECETDEDCMMEDGLPAQCIDGFCYWMPVPECQSDQDCPDGMVCEHFCFEWENPDGTVEEECYAECVEPWEPECETDEDCAGPDGLVGQCIDGWCDYQSCQEDADCPEGHVCAPFCYEEVDPCGQAITICYNECIPACG